jgi:hypothetical protein
VHTHTVLRTNSRINIIKSKVVPVLKYNTIYCDMSARC